jgi:hypothetical protein
MTEHTGYTFNRVKFTKDEETCLLRLLFQARDCGNCNVDEEWLPLCNDLITKYYNSQIKEAQPIQTL